MAKKISKSKQIAEHFFSKQFGIGNGSAPQ